MKKFVLNTSNLYKNSKASKNNRTIIEKQSQTTFNNCNEENSDITTTQNQTKSSKTDFNKYQKPKKNTLSKKKELESPDNNQNQSESIKKSLLDKEKFKERKINKIKTTTKVATPVKNQSNSKVKRKKNRKENNVKSNMPDEENRHRNEEILPESQILSIKKIKDKTTNMKVSSNHSNLPNSSSEHVSKSKADSIYTISDSPDSDLECVLYSFDDESDDDDYRLPDNKKNTQKSLIKASDNKSLSIKNEYDYSSQYESSSIDGTNNSDFSENEYHSSSEKTTSYDYTLESFQNDSNDLMSSYENSFSDITNSTISFEMDSEYYSYSFGNESDDEDFKLPDNVKEDIYIKKGEANIYEMEGSIVSFDSNQSTLQVKEIPNRKPCLDIVPVINENIEGKTKIKKTNCSKNETISKGSSLNYFKTTPKIFKIDVKEKNLLEDNLSELYITKNNDILECVDSLLPCDKSSQLLETNKISSQFVNQISPHVEDSDEELHSRTSKINIFDENIDKLNKSKIYNSFGTPHIVLVVLKDEISFYGTLNLKVITGRIEIFGYEAEENEIHNIYSPLGNSYISCLPLGCKNLEDKKTLEEKIFTLSEDFFIKHLKEILSIYEPNKDAIILLQRNYDDISITHIKSYMPDILFPKSQVLNPDSSLSSSEYIVRCLISTEKNKSFQINDLWNSIDVSHNSKVLIIGGKNVGKSTCLRYLINRNLKKYKKILAIDIDIGQPEFFLPQTISATIIDSPIFGCGNYQKRNQIKSLLFKDLNVVMAPYKYIEIVKELIKFCETRQDLQNIPWFINTMGYNKGLGCEITTIIIQMIKPTDVIQIHDSKSNNFEYLITPMNIKNKPINFLNEFYDHNLELNYNFHKIPSYGRNKNCQSDHKFSSKEIRNFIVLLHLRYMLNQEIKLLHKAQTYFASLADLKIISFDDEIPEELYPDVLDANLVYLCKQETNYEFIECLGVGIVRGVDVQQQKVYLLSSIPGNSLKEVNSISFNCIPMPESIYFQKALETKGDIPYVHTTRNPLSSKHVRENIYRPQSFMKGKQSESNIFNCS